MRFYHSYKLLCQLDSFIDTGPDVKDFITKSNSHTQDFRFSGTCHLSLVATRQCKEDQVTPAPTGAAFQEGPELRGPNLL